MNFNSFDTNIITVSGDSQELTDSLLFYLKVNTKPLNDNNINITALYIASSDLPSTTRLLTGVGSKYYLETSDEEYYYSSNKYLFKENYSLVLPKFYNKKDFWYDRCILDRISYYKSIPSYENQYQNYGESPGYEDKFGEKVIISGNGKRIAVSSFNEYIDEDIVSGFNSVSGKARGVVRIYEKDENNNFILLKRLVAYQLLDNDYYWNFPEEFSHQTIFGYSISFNYEGTILAIGITIYGNNNINPGRCGNVQVYRQEADNIYNWQLIGNNIGSDHMIANTDGGYSVSLNKFGSILAIGCPGIISDNGIDGAQGGFVLVYNFNQGIWQDYPQYNKNKISCLSSLQVNTIGSEFGQRFGHSLKLNSNGDKIIIGAPFNIHDDSIRGNTNDSILFSPGYSAIFQVTSDGWQLIGNPIQLTNYPVDSVTAPFTNINFGFDVDLNDEGDIIFIVAKNQFTQENYNEKINRDNLVRWNRGDGAVHILTFDVNINDWVYFGNNSIIFSQNKKHFSSNRGTIVNCSTTYDGKMVVFGSHKLGNNERNGVIFVYFFNETTNTWEQISELYNEYQYEYLGYFVFITRNASFILSSGRMGIYNENYYNYKTGTIRFFKFKNDQPQWYNKNYDIHLTPSHLSDTSYANIYFRYSFDNNNRCQILIKYKESDDYQELTRYFKLNILTKFKVHTENIFRFGSWPTFINNSNLPIIINDQEFNPNTDISYVTVIGKDNTVYQDVGIMIYGFEFDESFNHMKFLNDSSNTPHYPFIIPFNTTDSNKYNYIPPFNSPILLNNDFTDFDLSANTFSRSPFWIDTNVNDRIFRKEGYVGSIGLFPRDLSIKNIQDIPCHTIDISLEQHNGNFYLNKFDNSRIVEIFVERKFETKFIFTNNIIIYNNKKFIVYETIWQKIFNNLRNELIIIRVLNESIDTSNTFLNYEISNNINIDKNISILLDPSDNEYAEFRITSSIISNNLTINCENISRVPGFGMEYYGKFYDNIVFIEVTTDITAALQLSTIYGYNGINSSNQLIVNDVIYYPVKRMNLDGTEISFNNINYIYQDFDNDKNLSNGYINVTPPLKGNDSYSLNFILNLNYFKTGKIYAVFYDDGTILNTSGFNGNSNEKIDTMNNNTNNITIFSI